MHELVSDASSRAENWTDFRKNEMRVFFVRKLRQIFKLILNMLCICSLVGYCFWPKTARRETNR